VDGTSRGVRVLGGEAFRPREVKSRCEGSCVTRGLGDPAMHRSAVAQYPDFGREEPGRRKGSVPLALGCTSKTAEIGMGVCHSGTPIWSIFIDPGLGHASEPNSYSCGPMMTILHSRDRSLPPVRVLLHIAASFTGEDITWG